MRGLRASRAAAALALAVMAACLAPCGVGAAGFDAAAQGQRHPAGFWGAHGSYPDTHVAALTLVLDNTEIAIPAKIYSDLGNVRIAEIKENRNAVVLVLRGGADEAAYYATYVFVDGVLRKRTVRSSLMPDRVWEKTTFNAPLP